MDKQESLQYALEALRTDSIEKSKRGLNFIMASVFVWIAILFIHTSGLPIQTKNLYTFFCSIPLFPLAFFFSKVLNIEFQNKENPLSGLGILVALNQMLYILIAMWVYAAMPEKMLMVYAMIFGAHLLPYGWLYQSKSYYILSVIIPIMVLLLGISFSNTVISVFMLITESIFCILLMIENKISNDRKIRKEA